ncbi:TIGR02444 family protein [Endozoicomonas sp. SM1973]|uniref:TIGR02444 family protein n=1 Tax=Spartinivicinus marinus TaxID=2994442 RepID=A0A853ILH4_9GAMM|nr:TIGR02444 family protein [Spartinivicinus marinus]NYZ68596.1 TIGR02444 family protein [Spartinivicinus marinus]
MNLNTIPQVSTTTNPFWEFSCTVYQQTEIAKTALHFQDKWQLSINFLLFCSFCSLNNKQLSQQNSLQLWQQLAQWHQEYTLQIRKLRQKLKCYSSDEEGSLLYQLIKQMELHFEYHEQQILFRHFNELDHISQKKPADLFITNTSNYLNSINQFPFQELLTALSVWFNEIIQYWQTISAKRQK